MDEEDSEARNALSTVSGVSSSSVGDDLDLKMLDNLDLDLVESICNEAVEQMKPDQSSSVENQPSCELGQSNSPEIMNGEVSSQLSPTFEP